MSAIFGLIHLDGRPVADADLERMSQALTPHGPDANGTWSDGSIGLGQRLARLTQEDRLERQPIYTVDGRHVLIADARIDNRPELMQELGMHPAEARELPDSGFILRSYEKWGCDCAAHLVGAFVFAIYDLSDHRMLIARSPMGERSLFYYETSQVFAFASAPKGLFALPFVPREINRQTMADFLAFKTYEPGASFFAGVRRLPPGQSMVVHGTKVRLWQNRSLHPCREIRFPRDHDYVEAFLGLFDRVVADYVRSLTPVGVSMSGGLDSTTIGAAAALILERDGKRLQAFTEVPRADFNGAVLNGWYGDETPFVEAMARKYPSIDVHFIRLDEPFYLDTLNQFFAAAEAPLLGVSSVIWMDALKRAADAQGVRVMLNGVSGNFTISHDGDGLLPQLLRAGKWREAFREAQALAAQESGLALPGVLMRRGLTPLVPNRLWLAAHRLRASGLAGLRPPRHWEYRPPIRREFARAQRVEERACERMRYFRFGAPPDVRFHGLLRRADRRSDQWRGHEAAYRLYQREPATDMRVVEFCLSIPEDQYLRHGESRWLIRRAGVGRLPPEVILNRKRGSQMGAFFQSMSGARARILTELDRIERSELASEMVDLVRIRRLIEGISGAAGDLARIYSDYFGAVNVGLATASFLAWMETGK